MQILKIQSWTKSKEKVSQPGALFMSKFSKWFWWYVNCNQEVNLKLNQKVIKFNVVFRFYSVP